MKKLFILLLLISPLCLFAQTDQLDLGSLGKNALVIVDGKKVDGGSVKGMFVPDDLADVTILKDASVTAKYGPEGANGVIIITTRKFAIAAYQEKFSDFSADLESYLTSHGTDDKQFIYMIDDVAVPKDRAETSKLYHLPKEKIENVVFIQDQPEGSKILAKIAITTKK